MALAKKCDRCGKLYEHYPTGYEKGFNGIKRIEKYEDGRIHFEQSGLDFCQDCMMKFEYFMRDGYFEDLEEEQ